MKTLKDPKIIDDLLEISNRLTGVGELVHANDPGSMGQVSRALDVLIECAASARARADGMPEAKRLAFVRRIRGALGYTYS